VNVIFLGSGPFGLPALECLSTHAGDLQLVRVVTRPDRPGGRGKKLLPTPVRARALALGLPCDAPESVNDPSYLEALAILQPDLAVVADYGEMLRIRVRELPRIGAFNLHASLLPHHRGAAPVSHAIIEGEEITGVTLFRVEKELDSGPIIDREEVRIDPLETAGELEERLSVVAARLLERNLEAFRTGTFREIRQDGRLATFAPKLTKARGLIDWNCGSRGLTDLVRGLNPWPGAYSFLRRPGKAPERTAFLRVKPAASRGGGSLPPGTVEEVRRDGFRIRCHEGSVEVLQIRREGKVALDAPAYLRGRCLEPGDVFGPA